MKKFSKKGSLLFVSAMAVCAFAMPSTASAASWGLVGTEHTLTSTGIGFTVPATGLTSVCTENRFTSRVDNASTLTVTTGTFGGLCTSNFPAAGIDCTTTTRGTGFPWRATARTTTLIDIHDVLIDILFEDMPGRPGSCGALVNTTMTLTGTLANGHWNHLQREIVWRTGTGLHSSTSGTIALSGTLRDTQQNLTVTG